MTSVFRQVISWIAMLSAVGVVIAWNARKHDQERIRGDGLRTDAALMADPLRAGPELERRLREHVNSREGMLIVTDTLPGIPTIYVLPMSAMWVVSCDILGLSVAFGPGSGEYDNSVNVDLTRVPISPPQCRDLAPMIGEKVLAITRGN